VQFVWKVLAMMLPDGGAENDERYDNKQNEQAAVDTRTTGQRCVSSLVHRVRLHF